jgi:hypothetical protein
VRVRDVQGRALCHRLVRQCPLLAVPRVPSRRNPGLLPVPALWRCGSPDGVGAGRRRETGYNLRPNPSLMFDARLQGKRQAVRVTRLLGSIFCATGRGSSRAGFGLPIKGLHMGLNRQIFSRQSRVYCRPEQFYYRPRSAAQTASHQP